MCGVSSPPGHRPVRIQGDVQVRDEREERGAILRQGRAVPEESGGGAAEFFRVQVLPGHPEGRALWLEEASQRLSFECTWQDMQRLILVENWAAPPPIK